MAVAVAPPASPSVAPNLAVARAGPRYWLHGYWRMFVWDLMNLRRYLPILASILIMQGTGLVLGVGLFFRHIPESAAIYVVSGVPVLSLLTVGLIFEPQIVADQRAEGSYDFVRSLPVPRSMMTMAWYTVSLIPAFPAMVIALLVGMARYHFHLDVTPPVVPAVLATSFTGMLMGYALAHGITNPMTTRQVSGMLVFVLFGFSPVMFPATQLPHWLAEVNLWLPFESMATIIRDALVKGMVTGVGRAYLVLGVWALVSGLVTARVVGHRR